MGKRRAYDKEKLVKLLIPLIEEAFTEAVENALEKAIEEDGIETVIEAIEFYKDLNINHPIKFLRTVKSFTSKKEEE